MLYIFVFSNYSTLRSEETKTISNIKLSKHFNFSGEIVKKDLYSTNCFDLQSNQMFSTNLVEVSRVYFLG